MTWLEGTLIAAGVIGVTAALIYGIHTGNFMLLATLVVSVLEGLLGD